MMTIEPCLRHAFGARCDADVKFGAIAGGQDHRLVNTGLMRQFAQGDGGRIFVKGHLFAQADRRGEMVEPEGDQFHDVMRWEAASVSQRRLLDMAGL